MPIYEYLCEQCGRRSEAIQRLGDAPLTECPDCGGQLKKMFSAPSFQLKGSGWYKTDYAAPGAKQGASAKEAGDSGSAGEAAASTKSAEGDKKTATGGSTDAAPASTARTDSSASKPTPAASSSE
jgi:putative FmdB family regulatory protein